MDIDLKHIDLSPEAALDIAEIVAEDLIQKGETIDHATEAAAKALDRLVPFDKIVPGLPGVLLEAHDEDMFRAFLKTLRNLFKVDPERRAARRAKKAANKAERQARRAEKREE